MIEDVGLRERKKIKLHQLIVENAWKLFTEKGFDNVKVSDIADMTDISVKTLFTYFNSKEDIIFSGEDELLDEIITAIHSRRRTECIADSVKALIQRLLNQKDDPIAVGATDLTQLISSNPTVKKRLLIMWQKYENKLRDVLAADLSMRSDDPRAYVIASNLVLPFRMLFDLKINGEEDQLVNIQRLDQVMSIIKNGLKDY